VPEESNTDPASRLKRLEQLSQVTREMMSGLASLTRDELLGRIAQYAVEILGAETCGVFLVYGDELSLEAGFGHRKEAFFKGRRLPIRDCPGGGLTGFIAFERKKEAFNLHGEELAQHPAVAREPSHSPSGRCDSLLAINLFRKREGLEDLIGLLRVDNKKGMDGQPSPTLWFGPEDEWLLTLFADAAVVAIESAELVSQLKEQKDFTDRLIASSPDGIIAVDRKGRVTAYNPQAKDILEYPPGEVLGFPVDQLYDDPAEPRHIGSMLHSGKGRVRDYETAVRSKSGERVPVRHSSTWLFNADGQRVGSVGYFEDLRRRRLLLEASNLLASADHLDAGLQKLAEMMVTQLGRSFCGILLTDEGGESLILRASATLRPTWKPRQGERFRLSEWPGLRELLERGRPSVRRLESAEVRPTLERLSQVLGCESLIQCLLVVPLTLEGRVVGQLDLGVLAGDPGDGFTLEERHLVSAIAKQVTALIDRMSLQEASRRTFRQFAVLHRIGDYIQATEELDKILRTILTGVTASYGLGFNRASLLLLDDDDNHLVGQMGIGEIDEEQARNAWRKDSTKGLDDFGQYLDRLERGVIAVTTVGRRVRGLRIPVDGTDPFSEAVRTRKPVRVSPSGFAQLPADFFNALQPTTPLLIAPLVAKKGVLGALAVDNKFTSASIGEDLLDSLMTFANTVAIVLENKRLLQETVSGREKLLSYYQDSSELLSLRDPEEILHALVEQTYRVSGAWGVSILLLDAEGRIQSPIQFGQDRELRPDDTLLVRSDGITAQGARAGQPADGAAGHRVCPLPAIGPAGQADRRDVDPLSEPAPFL
jgi:PAS domain S-box-containing protein